VSNVLPVTVLLAVRNEAVNLPRCLEALAPAARIVAIDSHSSDGTAEICRTHGAEVVQFDYRGGYPKKRQWALDTLDIATPWILLLDADEVVPEALWREIGEAITSDDPCDGYFIRKGFHFLGRRFRHGGFSHRALLLVRAGRARFERLFDDRAESLDMEIHERVIVEGRTGSLETPLIHEDFKGLEAYIYRHNKYSTWEARLRHCFLRTGAYGEDTIRPRLLGNSQERRRALKALVIRLPIEPWLWFGYHYVLRLGLLEGRPGLIAARIRATYIADVRAKVHELALASRARAAHETRETET